MVLCHESGSLRCFLSAGNQVVSGQVAGSGRRDHEVISGSTSFGSECRTMQVEDAKAILTKHRMKSENRVGVSMFSKPHPLPEFARPLYNSPSSCCVM